MRTYSKVPCNRTIRLEAFWYWVRDQSSLFSRMPFTFWHRDQLIGETEFEGERNVIAPHRGERRHLAGIFRPTAYGRRILPRLCGIMTAGFALKEELVRRGVDPEDAPPEMMEHLFETTAAGAHVLDLGRALTEVCVRDPGGVKLKIASIGFMDLNELASLSRQIDTNQTVDFDHVPAEVAEFLVSVTLCDLKPYCGPMMPLQ